MYKDAGKSIKECVKTIVTISMIGWIIMGIAIGALLYKSFGDVGILIGLVIAGMGCFFAWLSGLILYAYGDIADNVQHIKNTIAADTQVGTISKISTEGKAKKPTWKCASCGAENVMTKTYCVECNVSRAWTEAKRNKNV